MKRFLAIFLTASVLFSNTTYAAKNEPSVWAKGDIEAAYSLGIVPDSLMSSYDSSISRSEFCSLCARTLKAWGAEASNAEITFNDITAEDTDIIYCASLGVVSGVGNGKFEPSRNITRQEAARMLYNAFSFVLTDVSNGNGGVLLPHVFDDGDKISSWARNEIYAMYHTGVMMGDAKNCFNPSDSYTREQAICTFWRLYSLKDSESLNVNPEYYMVGKYEPYIEGFYNHYTKVRNRCYLNLPYQWYDGENEAYSPEYIDGFSNTYTAKDLGYVYPTNEKYMEVLTSTGVGVSASTVIDKNKKEVTSDCNISTVKDIVGDYALVLSDYGDKAVNLKTGEYVTVNGDDVTIKSVGCGMYFAGNQKLGYCFLNSDMQPVSDYRYMNLEYNFLNNMVAALTPDGEFEIINTEGKILKSTKIDLNKYSVYNVYGTNAILFNNIDNKNDILRVGSNQYINKYDYASFTADGEINVAEGDNIYLLDTNCNVKKMTSANGDTYSDLYSCTANSDFRLASKTSRTSPYVPEPYDVLNVSGKVIADGLTSDYIGSDGGGVYCGRRGDNELVLFDSSGTRFGTINTDFVIDSFCFVNGLLRVETNNKHIYYLPNGSRADFINDKIDN
jgi:hypothetical protein